MTRIALFDWVSGGHHPIYIRRFAEVLRPWADVVAAAPDETIADLADLGIDTISLGSQRPRLSGRLSSRRRRVVAREAKLVERVVYQSQADHLIHLYADTALPGLLGRPRLSARISLLLFYPLLHYPRSFGAELTRSEWAKAWANATLTALWRRRPDSHAVLTLDEEAASRWRRAGGAPAYWIPEPPVGVSHPTVANGDRAGCVLYGALAPRKGIDLLAAALAIEPTPVRITIAGDARQAFIPALQKHVARMRAGGAEVTVRAHRHTEREGMGALAKARCAVLPYPRHNGMSRILLEACSVGTPVVIHEWGLLGHLVRQHGLGLAVDCRDPRALRRAILELATDPDAAARYREALARFASRFSRESFACSVRAPFGGSARAEAHRQDLPPLRENVPRP